MAPHNLRQRFTQLIRIEAENAKDGKPTGIRAKMKQLQDPQIIHELYQASQAGVPILLNVRGLCCLKPRIPNLSPTIRVYSTLGRFLEHGRIFRFENAGDPLFFIGSADWMRRNLDKRIETITPVFDAGVKQELEEILNIYEADNCTAWDLYEDGHYERREPDIDEKNAVPRKFSSASPQNFRQRIPSPETNGFFQNSLMLSLVQDGTNPGHNSKIRFAKDMMTRLLILSCMTFWAGGMLSAEPDLAPHLSIPFKDTGKGYNDRLPWAVSYLPKFDWSKKLSELEYHRRKSFQKDVDELAQFQLFQKQRIQRVRNTNQRVEALIRTVNRKVPEWALKN